MTSKLSRRNFLELSLATLISACTPAIAKQAAPAATAPQPPASATFTEVKETETLDSDTSLRVYSPDDPNILYTGRIDFSDAKQPKFSAPGIYIRAKFRGTAASVMVEDEFKWGTSRNYYDAVIDDATVVKISPEKGVTQYAVASDLPNAEHTITLVKRTEASIGYTKFLGFEFAGKILPPPARPSRRIEFIGDSITVGTGDEAVNDPQKCLEDGWGQPYNNAWLAFGPALARQKNAEYHVSAVSGIGLVRNYSFQYDARPLPEAYDLLFYEQEDSPVWDHTRFVPEVVVIGLGTNDFSPGDSERPTMEVDTFVNAYVQFVGKLREYYPDAHIFCVSSPMLGDGWPNPSDKSATNQKTAITAVVDKFNGDGDVKVHKYFMSPMVGMGCATHPSVDQHTMLAALLGSHIASVAGW